MNIELKPIEQQVVVVMGASSGIGRATALEFARRGARVMVSARSQEGLDSLVEQIRYAGGQAEAVVADVTDFEEVQTVARRAAATFGRIDTWVHTAAVAIYANFEQMTPEEFMQVIDVNLLGQVHGAMAALPYLRQVGRGALIHISSVESKRALPYHSAYAASKHGIAGFVDALRLELMHEGVPISVTNIMPATINTPFFNKAKTKLGVEPKGQPPVYEPEQVAEAILYAAENPVRDLIVGGAGKLMVWGQAFAPSLMDSYMLATAFQGQRTNTPKSENAPNNLFVPIDEYNQVKGYQKQPSLPSRLYHQLQASSGLTTAVAGIAVGAAALWLTRSFTGGSQDENWQQQRMRLGNERWQPEAWQAQDIPIAMTATTEIYEFEGGY